MRRLLLHNLVVGVRHLAELDFQLLLGTGFGDGRQPDTSRVGKPVGREERGDRAGGGGCDAQQGAMAPFRSCLTPDYRPLDRDSGSASPG
jgi:hypothetical protein